MSRRQIMGGAMAALALTVAAGAQVKYSVLHEFGGSGDGAFPASGLAMGSSGVLYGVTNQGGTGICSGQEGCGTVYSLTSPGTAEGKWTEKILYSFRGGSDGALPSGVAVGTDGVLYGTTTYGGGGACRDGGLTGCGTVFALTPPGTAGGAWTETAIYSFSGGTEDGALPRAGVTIGSDGTLYGTTEYGGAGVCTGVFSGCGTVFAVTAPAWTEAVLYAFQGGPGDGSIPLSGVALMGGTLYGTTTFGGTGASGYGVVYELTPSSTGNGWSAQVLHVFDETDGAYPQAGVLPTTSPGGETILFGTTPGGGTSFSGTVFALTETHGLWKDQVLYSFSGEGESGPQGGVVKASD
ncbi:MAG: choice-of-anchor tandem repeat GloVer-containing protein [Bryobacteraceae bacterium]|jgi:uncharacterized repeat protein (TIGR03803 family)